MNVLADCTNDHRRARRDGALLASGHVPERREVVLQLSTPAAYGCVDGRLRPLSATAHPEQVPQRVVSWSGSPRGMLDDGAA
jgi:hypothetical protein